MPCRTTVPAKSKGCKPFQICAGNHVLYWDGTCASIQERKYQIPNGTFTSITFENGCIVDVGQAPIPVYTPLACCGESSETSGESVSGPGLVVGNNKGNLARVVHGELTVEPEWSSKGNVKVTGQGTLTMPWEANIAVSKSLGNSLEQKDDGLFARLYFKTTNTVTVEGKGTAKEPYLLNVKAAEVTLPEILKNEIEGPGYEIDKFGRIKPDDGLTFVTNLTFVPAEIFHVETKGPATTVTVDVAALKGGSFVADQLYFSGNGTAESPLTLNFDNILAALAERGVRPA